MTDQQAYRRAASEARLAARSWALSARFNTNRPHEARRVARAMLAVYRRNVAAYLAAYQRAA